VRTRPLPDAPDALAPESDDFLVQRIAVGDRDAFAELYDRYAPTLLATAQRMLGEREAHDVLHDVFLEAWAHSAEYSVERGSVRTWLLVRLRSRALDRLARVERTRTRSLEPQDELPSTYSSRVTQREPVDRIAVRSALEKLGPEVRDALESFYFAGLTAREIAESAGVPVGTVKSRIARGLAMLWSLLGEEREADDGHD